MPFAVGKRLGVYMLRPPEHDPAGKCQAEKVSFTSRQAMGLESCEGRPWRAVAGERLPGGLHRPELAALPTEPPNRRACRCNATSPVSVTWRVVSDPGPGVKVKFLEAHIWTPRERSGILV